MSKTTKIGEKHKMTNGEKRPQQKKHHMNRITSTYQDTNIMHVANVLS